MSLAPVEKSYNEVRYWFVSNPDSIGPLANFRAPDRVAAVVSENVTDDGQSFEDGVFGAGDLDAVFALMDAEAGEKVYGYIAAKLAGRKTAEKIMEEDGASVMAMWTLPEGRVALLAGDQGSATVQELWDEACRLAKVPPYEEGRVFSSDSFSAELVQAQEGELAYMAQSMGAIFTKPRPRLG